MHDSRCAATTLKIISAHDPQLLQNTRVFTGGAPNLQWHEVHEVHEGRASGGKWVAYGAEGQKADCMDCK